MAALDNAVHTKDPDAKKSYGVDWTAFLALGETILTSTWVVPTGITQASPSPSFTGAVTTIWLSGGTVGSSYTITNRITTSTGLIDDASLVIMIADQ